MKFGLDTIRTLLHAMGNPETDYPSLLVAGTNGKGSVARFIRSACAEAGLKTGLFTSPHLVSVRERLEINGQIISKARFAEQLTSVTATIDALGLESHPTFFETITATALNYFSEEDVDISILEVGLGGRLDSTNAVDPLLSILTKISYDHQQFLGNTLGQIGAEKAGILRASRRALSVPQLPEVRGAIRSRAEKINCQLEEVDLSEIEHTGCLRGRYRFTYHGVEYQLGAWGEHQIVNAALSIRSAETLRGLGFQITSKNILDGIQNTRIPAVLERVQTEPDVFLDGAHNPDAVANLIKFLEEHTKEPRTLVFGIMKDKNIHEVLATLSRPFREVYLTQIPSPRAAALEDLHSIYPHGKVVDKPYMAYQTALTGAATTVVAGSFHLVGEILKGLGAGE